MPRDPKDIQDDEIELIVPLEGGGRAIFYTTHADRVRELLEYFAGLEQIGAQEDAEVFCTRHIHGATRVDELCANGYITVNGDDPRDRWYVLTNKGRALLQELSERAPKCLGEMTARSVVDYADRLGAENPEKYQQRSPVQRRETLSSTGDPTPKSGGMTVEPKSVESPAKPRRRFFENGQLRDLVESYFERNRTDSGTSAEDVCAWIEAQGFNRPESGAVRKTARWKRFSAARQALLEATEEQLRGFRRD